MKCLTLENGKNLIIRNASADDATNMIAYLHKISSQSDFLTFGEGELNITIEQEKMMIESCLNAENKLFIVAEIDGEIIGNLNFHGGIRSRIKHTGEFGVSVLKEYWGMGIGKALIIYLIDWAKAGNVIKKINLRTREDNNRGIHLYKKLGFVEEGVISRDFFVDGVFYSSISMGLIID